MLHENVYATLHSDFLTLVNPNPCENNGGCQTLCILKPGGKRVCACPEDFVLAEDGTTCVDNCSSSQFVCRNTFKCIPR